VFAAGNVVPDPVEVGELGGVARDSEGVGLGLVGTAIFGALVSTRIVLDAVPLTPASDASGSTKPSVSLSST
jgi:hypothetical protein